MRTAFECYQGPHGFSLYSICTFLLAGTGRFGVQRCRTFDDQNGGAKLTKSCLGLPMGWNRPLLSPPQSFSHSDVPGDNNKQTQYPQGISEQRRKLCLLKKNVQKFAVLLERPPLLLFVNCAHSSFSLDFSAGHTVSGCYDVTMLT